MIYFFALSVAMGWIAGIWLSWWAIGVILMVVALSVYKGAFDGGLEAIPKVLGTGAFVPQWF